MQGGRGSQYALRQSLMIISLIQLQEMGVTWRKLLKIQIMKVVYKCV